MKIFAYINFGYVNYIRQHRYIREIVVALIFHIFFWAFLYGDQPDDSIWMVLSVFAILLNLVTAPSIFFLEKGNTLYFLLSKPHGRRNLFLSKIFLILLIDLIWILFFALIYGMQFFSVQFFLLLPLRLFLVGLILLITTLLISFAFSYRPQLSWLIFALIIFGSIVNKSAVLPMKTIMEFYKILIFFLPPILELNFLAVELSFSKINPLFAAMTCLHVVLLFSLSYRGIMHKDLL